MAQISFPLLLVFLTILCLSTGVDSAGRRRHSRVRAYLEGQCKVTRYPKLCFECLSTYGKATTLQGPQQLAQIALTVTLTKAQYTKAYISTLAKQFNSSKARDLQAVKDCLRQINDGVDQITQSITEFRRIGHDGELNFIWHESNIESWISAALTDTTTCIDGFSGHAVGGKAKAMIKAKVLNVAQHTSNALALFNRFARRHRATRAFKLP